MAIIRGEAIENIKRHKYSGSDEGLLYKYFYDPVATKLVSCLPTSVAPNTLTVLGLLCTVIPFLVLMSISGAYLVGEVPSWFLYVHAATYLIYRMLDEMDGKQARRTDNSSPLGLLFDHGCDCFTIGLQNIMISKELCVGENPIAMMSLITAYMVFHFTTLEEYYLGTLKLPIFNGVSDGSLVIIALLIFTGAIGNTWWAEDACDATWLGISSVTNLNKG